MLSCQLIRWRVSCHVTVSCLPRLHRVTCLPLWSWLWWAAVLVGLLLVICLAVLRTVLRGGSSHLEHWQVDNHLTTDHTNRHWNIITLIFTHCGWLEPVANDVLVFLNILQLYLCRKLPSRALSHSSGRLARAHMPRLLRRPLFGVFVRLFGCNMAEAVEQDLQSYPNFHSLFTRSLKHEVRPIAQHEPLVSRGVRQ